MSTTTPAVRSNGNGNGHTVAKTEDRRVATVRSLLTRMTPEIRKALPKHLDPDRMARLALTAIRSDQKLLSCTPESLMASVMQAAQVGLEIDGMLGHAYLIPFWNGREKINEAKLLIGYKGYILLARRSKQIDTIEAHAVYGADEFRYEYGSNAYLKHVPARGADRGEFVGAWAMTRFRGSSRPQFEFMDAAKIEARRRRSKQPDKGPWQTDYEAMAVKTVLRQHAKNWPLTPVEQALVASEDWIDAGLEPSLPTDLAAPALEAPPTRSSELADALEDQAAIPTATAPADDYDDWELNGDKS